MSFFYSLSSTCVKKMPSSLLVGFALIAITTAKKTTNANCLAAILKKMNIFNNLIIHISG
jgi:hypothetical protein